MLQDHYPREVAYNLMNFLGTHDTKRILTILRDKSEKDAFKMLKIASAILYCAPGVPAIFYGDEAGVVGGDAPFSRVCFPWDKEDKATLEWYRKLGCLRTNDVLANGDCNVLFAHNGVFIMERRAGNNRVILAANCSHEDFKLNIESPMTDFETNKIVKDSILLKPYGFVILS
jgi:pullulanase